MKPTAMPVYDSLSFIGQLFPKMISIYVEKSMGLPGLRMGAIIHQDTIFDGAVSGCKRIDRYTTNPIDRRRDRLSFRYKDKSVYLKKVT